MPPSPVPDRTAGLTSAEERALRHLDRSRANRTPTARTDNGDAVVGATAAKLVRRGLARYNPMVGPRSGETFVSITPEGRRALLPPPLEATLADGSQVTLALASCHFCGGHDDTIGMRVACPACKGRRVELARYIIARSPEPSPLPRGEATGGNAPSEVALRVLRLLMADHLIETTTEADPAEYLYWMDGWKVGYSTDTPPCDLASVDPDAAELLARLTSEAGQ